MASTLLLSLVVERRGVPVAEIIPFRKPVHDADRERKLNEYFALLDRGLPLGGADAPTKDKMHER